MTIVVTMQDPVNKAPVIQAYRLHRHHLVNSSHHGKLNISQPVMCHCWRLVAATGNMIAKVLVTEAYSQ